MRNSCLLHATLLHSQHSNAHCLHNAQNTLHYTQYTYYLLNTAQFTHYTVQCLKHSPLLLRTVFCGSLRASLRGLQVNRPYRHPPHCLLSVRGGTKVAPSGLLPASGPEIVAPGQGHRSSRWSCQCLTRQCVSESVESVPFQSSLSPLTPPLSAPLSL